MFHVERPIAWGLWTLVLGGCIILCMKELTPKQDKFLKRYLETGNGTQAALETYETDSREVASAIASENLRKPSIMEKFKAAQDIAHATIVALATGAENESVRLKAAQDIVDRTEGRATQKTEVEARVFVEQVSEEDKSKLLALLNDKTGT